MNASRTPLTISQPIAANSRQISGCGSGKKVTPKGWAKNRYFPMFRTNIPSFRKREQ